MDECKCPYFQGIEEEPIDSYQTEMTLNCQIENDFRTTDTPEMCKTVFLSKCNQFE